MVQRTSIVTTVQVQQNWIFSNNVNSIRFWCEQSISIGSTGTEIFAGRKEYLISVMEGTNKTDLYTATVPKIGVGDNIPITENAFKIPTEEVERRWLENYIIQFCEISNCNTRQFFQKKNNF